MEYIEISTPITGEISTPQSSIEHRDGILEKAKLLPATVDNQEQLEAAVEVLKELAGIEKETEKARKEVKEPALAIGKKIDDVAKTFVAPVVTAKKKLSDAINSFQAEQLKEQQKREREARAQQAEAERKAREAQAEIERQQKLLEQAKTPEAIEAAEDALLTAQLAEEKAALSQQSAETALATPTNTPRGLVVRSRFNFEITDVFKLIAKVGNTGFIWHAKDENLKFDRAGLLKSLNNEAAPHPWLPDETQQSVQHAFGIRIFRDVTNHVRS